MLRDCEAFVGMPVVHALRCFRRVRTCFGLELQQGFQEAIAQFAQAYEDLEIAHTPKVHVLIDHVLPFLLGNSKNCRLGYWAEHASEAMHHDVNPIWLQCYKVGVINPQYMHRSS